MAELRDGHLFISDMYNENKEYKKALEHYKQYTSLTDSLFNAEKQNELTRHEMNYDFEKKELALKAEQEKRDAVAVSDRKRQKAFLMLICAIAAAIAVITIVVFRSLRIAKKQKLIIEDQKSIVEVKQKEILDSIYYARRIQRSLLPSETYIKKYLSKPKA